MEPQNADPNEQPPKRKRNYPKTRAKPGAFKLAPLFKEEDQIKISYLEISWELNIDHRWAKESVATDIKNGFITKERTTHKSPNYKRLLDGKNEYFLTEKGRKSLNRPGGNLKAPLSSSNSSKEEYIAKSAAPESDFLSKTFQKEILQKHGFTHLIDKAPFWWFKDPNFPKTLKLLKQKQSKGYRVQNPLKWISSTLKQEGVGYREKIVLETSQKLRGNIPTKTPFEKEVLNALKSLQSKGLDTSYASLKLFLRNGLSKLKSAIVVLEKYLQWNKPIKSLKGILSWIIEQKDPLELLKPIANSPEKQILKLKAFFTHNASHFSFSKPTPESSSNQPHIEFFIHQKALLSSVVKIYKKIGNEWRCLNLEMGKSGKNFYDLVTKTLHHHFGKTFEERGLVCS